MDSLKQSDVSCVQTPDGLGANFSPERGFEERMFACSNCQPTEKISVDPMKSDAVGWLAGELKPPL